MKIAPRVPTPVPSGSGGSSFLLPADVVADHVARLKLLSIISAGMWAVGLLLDAVLAPAVLGGLPNRPAIIIETVGVVLGTAIYLHLSFWKCPLAEKTDMGLWVMIVNSALIGLLETFASPIPAASHYLSWIAVVILISAMVAPSRPRRMLVAAFVSASLGPASVWLAYLSGVDVPTVGQTLLFAIPNYTCAICAVLPAKMFEQMGRRINEARALGSYELVDLLGTGGMGEVWRARHRLLARQAAVKLVKQEMLGRSDSEANHQLRRFEREAQATAALSSPHTIQLFDFGATDDGNFYYVMELLSGKDLESLVKEFGPLPADRVLCLMKQVCHSLGEAHAIGLVHRDVKPANIFACRMGLDYDFVKVLDFGLVQVRKADPAMMATETLVTAEHLIGTPAYMAPEVILGHETVDRRADVYALGCVMYYLLTGKRVFEDGSPMQALVDHVHTTPAAPSRKAALPIPRELDQLVLDCLRKSPDERPQDASEVLRRIASIGLAAGWSAARAEEWWREHLPLLTGPLTAPLAPRVGVAIQ